MASVWEKPQAAARQRGGEGDGHQQRKKGRKHGRLQFPSQGECGPPAVFQVQVRVWSIGETVPSSSAHFHGLLSSARCVGVT